MRPITPSALNGWKYHPDDAMSRFNIFRDPYERIEPPTRRWSHRINQGNNRPETGYKLMLLLWDLDRREGKPVDEAKVAGTQAGLRRTTPSSSSWRYGKST